MNFGSLGIAKILEEGLMQPAEDLQEATVMAVASRKESKAKEFATANSIEKYYGSYQSLIEDKDIDAVYIPLSLIHI